MRVGQSKGQIRPFLSLGPDHATGSPARRQGPADCQRLRRSPPAPYFLDWLFWKANLWRQAFFESKFEEACWTAKSSQKSSKILPKIFQNLPKILPKSLSGEGFGRLGGVLGAFLGVLGRLWVSRGRVGPSCGRPGGLLGRLGSKKVANMAPTWSPKRSPNREQIEAKIDQHFDGSWGRSFERLWWIWEGKVEPSWHQNRINCFEKTLIFI